MEEEIARDADRPGSDPISWRSKMLVPSSACDPTLHRPT